MPLSSSSFTSIRDEMPGYRYRHPGTTEEYVAADAGRCSVESYLPVCSEQWRDMLLRRADFATRRFGVELLEEVMSEIADATHIRLRTVQRNIEKAYVSVDPDADDRVINPPDAPEQRCRAEYLVRVFRNLLTAANYRELDHSVLEAALGESSHWGVPLKVDFAAFEHLVIFARGDVIGTRKLRRWQRLYREESVDVPLYQRMVVIFKLKEEAITHEELDHRMLHMRTFKNIPKQDIEMLLPNSEVRISWLDHTKILAPTIGKIGMSIFKLARLALVVAVLTYNTAIAITAVVIAIIGYIVRSVMTYLQTKRGYMLNLNRNLYYQKLDSNAATAFRLLQDSEQQQFREAIAAYIVALDHPLRESAEPENSGILNRQPTSSQTARSNGSSWNDHSSWSIDSSQSIDSSRNNHSSNHNSSNHNSSNHNSSWNDEFDTDYADTTCFVERAISPRKLKRRLERWVREEVKLEWDFDRNSAIEFLVELGLVICDAQGSVRVVPPNEALTAIRDWKSSHGDAG